MSALCVQALLLCCVVHVWPTAGDMQNVEAQWNDALKLSNEGDHAKAENIFKTIMWDVEQFAATLDKTEDPEQARA